MPDISSYTGKPYSFKRYNCWDHAVAVRKDNGIKTKAFSPKSMSNAFKIITAEMQRLDHGLTLVDAPQNYDVVIIKKACCEPAVYHCGVWFNGMVSHCSRDAGQVIMEPIQAFSAGYERVTFWR